VELVCDGCVLRPWRPGDEEELVRHADDRAVWRNLSDRFPSPYTLRHAEGWVALQGQVAVPRHFAITVDDRPVGGAGVEPGQDLHVRVGELGYWLGRAWWGRGLATRAARAMASYGFERLDLVRIEAGVLAWNPASARVLEKAGFQLEARQRQRAQKDGRVVDELLYMRLRDA